MEHQTKLTKIVEILDSNLQGENPETITDGQYHHIKDAMLEYGEYLLKIERGLNNDKWAKNTVSGNNNQGDGEVFYRGGYACNGRGIE